MRIKDYAFEEYLHLKLQSVKDVKCECSSLKKTRLFYLLTLTTPDTLSIIS